MKHTSDQVLKTNKKLKISIIVSLISIVIVTSLNLKYLYNIGYIEPSTYLITFVAFYVSLILLVTPLTVIFIHGDKIVYLMGLQIFGFIWFDFFFDLTLLLFIPWVINFFVIGYALKKSELALNKFNKQNHKNPPTL